MSHPDATDLATQLAQGRISSRDLVRSSLDAISRSAVHAFVHVDAQAALEQADAADRRRAAGQSLGALDGLPVAIKSNIAVSEWPHSAGLRFRRDDLALHDAFIVQRLRKAGAVLLGLTGMDEGALGAEGMNPWYGTVHNPRRPGYSAGGSSSGSGAAVVAGQCAFALGTDTIGSVRIPASFCGCVGYKPSFGLLSVSDVVPVHLRFDHVGLLTRSVRDLEWLLPSLAAHDPASKVSVPVTLQASSARLRGARIGFATGLDAFHPEDAVQAGFALAVDAARRRGAELVPIDLSRWDLPRVRRAILALCEVQMWQVHRDRTVRRPEDFSDGLRAFIRYGGKLAADEIRQAEERIAGFYRDWTAATAPLQATLLPTTACRAFPHGERRPQNTADLTAIASATGEPAIAVPVPIRDEMLPASVQLVGHRSRDPDLVVLATELEEHLAD